MSIITRLIENRKHRKRQRLLCACPRHEMLNMLSGVIKDNDGSVCLKKPVTVYADDIFGEIPVIVRIVKRYQTDNENYMDFDIGQGYSTEHLDTRELTKIIENL